jgi:hypothetical protein
VVGTNEKGKDIRKGEGEQIWWKYCELMCENGTIRPVEAILKEGRGIRESIG